MASDRIFGLVVVIGALAFFAGALQIQTSFLSDPLGPRVFPILISGASLLCGLSILARPDPEPHWPVRAAWVAMGAALVVLVAYAYAVVPLGFLIPTALASAAIGYLIDPKPVQSVIMGAALSAVLYIIFKFGLGLGLAALPRALMG
jgi:putative tricarboxylic transport membrane protein